MNSPLSLGKDNREGESIGRGKGHGAATAVWERFRVQKLIYWSNLGMDL